MTRRLSQEQKAARRRHRERDQRKVKRRKKHQTAQWQNTLLGNRAMAARPSRTDEICDAIRHYVTNFIKHYEPGSHDGYASGTLLVKERGTCQITINRLAILQDGEQTKSFLDLQCSYRGRGAAVGRHKSVIHYGDIADPHWAAQLDAVLWAALFIVNGASEGQIATLNGPFDILGLILITQFRLDFSLQRDESGRLWAIIGGDLATLEVWNGRFRFRPLSNIPWRYAHRELHLQLSNMGHTALRIKRLCDEIIQIRERLISQRTL